MTYCTTLFVVEIPTNYGNKFEFSLEKRCTVVQITLALMEDTFLPFPLIFIK